LIAKGKSLTGLIDTVTETNSVVNSPSETEYLKVSVVVSPPLCMYLTLPLTLSSPATTFPFVGATSPYPKTIFTKSVSLSL